MKKSNPTLATIAFAFVISLAGCKEKLPMERSEPYNRLHGIVNDGKTANEITLVSNPYDHSQFQTKLRFPPGVWVNVTTLGDERGRNAPIRKGFAHYASTGLSFSKEGRFITRTTGENVDSARDVSFQFMAGSPEGWAEWQGGKLRELISKAFRTTELTDLGLKEFITLQPKSNLVAGVTYVPLSGDDAMFFGKTQSIGCHVTATVSDLGAPLTGRLYLCGTTFQYSNGLRLTVIFLPILLSEWRELSREVNRLVDDIVVEGIR